MKTIAMVLVFVVVSLCACRPSSMPATQSTDTLQQAKQKGEAQAKADIAKGTMQILYYGSPWSMDKPLVDDASQLPVKIVGGCCVTPEFVAETDAYNAIMRQAASNAGEIR